MEKLTRTEDKAERIYAEVRVAKIVKSGRMPKIKDSDSDYEKYMKLWSAEVISTRHDVKWDNHKEAAAWNQRKRYKTDGKYRQKQISYQRKRREDPQIRSLNNEYQRKYRSNPDNADKIKALRKKNKTKAKGIRKLVAFELTHETIQKIDEIKLMTGAKFKVGVLNEAIDRLHSDCLDNLAK